MQQLSSKQIRRRAGWCLTLAIAVASCASQPIGDAVAPDWVPHADVATGVAACRDLVGSRAAAPDAGLDPADLRLLNWNIQKTRHPDAIDDLGVLAADSDLILIQEAALRSELMEPFERARFWTFAPGFRHGETRTGVMTVSAAMPLSRCSLMNMEPWLGTPKATSVTEYALRGRDETLVVVNIHAVNFTFGTQRYREQLEQIPTVLANHDGPIILSGDFNTWRGGREQVVADIARRLGLEPVEFEDDLRKAAFGRVLDHVYVRGLRHLEATTTGVATSDHNPMTVRLTRTVQVGK